MAKAIGILDLHGSNDLGPLTANRSIASTSFLGRYAFMDFPLSNFANSGIDQQGMLVRDHLRSIVQHLGNSHSWSSNTKLGGLSLLYDEPMASYPAYNNDVNNLLENSWFLKGTSGDVVVIAPSHILYRMDFRPLIRDHIKNNHRISVVVHTLNHGKTSFLGEDVATVDERGFLRDLNPNQGTEDEIDISMRTYIIDKEVLNGILNVARKTSAVYSLRDTIKMLAHDMPIFTYKHTGYIRCFDSMHNYLTYSLQLLKEVNFTNLFSPDWDIFTKTYDTPPAKYGCNANVKGSFIANGCQIDGTVINSIISRGVIVKEGAMIKDSVILSDSFISEDSQLSNVICDKNARILHAKDLISTPDKPVFIKRGDII